ncbi:hypothetical protein MRX96_005422 [Rhipicephalus microplus]
MVVAMEVDEFSTLATALATEQPQRRLTTLRPAKRQKPNDAEDGLESHIPEKTQAQEASITMQEGRQAASQVEAPTKVCMRLEEPQEEEGSQVLPATPSYAAAAEAERVADSGEGEKRAEHSARSASGDDETEDDAASAVSSVSVEEMAVEESCLERGHCDGKDNQEDRLAVRKGSQGGRRLSLKAKTEQVTSAATCSEWWNKQDDDDDVRHGEVLQSAVGKTPQQPRRTANVQEGVRRRRAQAHRTVQSQPAATAVRTRTATDGASQRCGREESQHGAVGMKPNREGKMTAADELEGQTGAASSDELEPGELIIDERAATPEPPNHTLQKAFSMPAGVGRGRNSRSRDPETAHGSILSHSLRPSGPGAHTETNEKRTRRSTKKARRDVAGRRRDSTPGSEHEEVKSKQRSSQQPATGDVDTDSDFY